MVDPSALESLSVPALFALIVLGQSVIIIQLIRQIGALTVALRENAIEVAKLIGRLDK